MSARVAPLLILSLVTLVLVAPAGSAAEESPAPLRAGESRILQRDDGKRLVSFGDDLRIALVETRGAEVLVRLTPLDRDGENLGVGRVIAVGPLERYELSLRSTFSDLQLEAVGLRVELRRGKGSVEVVEATGDGSRLRFTPQAGSVRQRPARPPSGDPSTEPSSNQLIDEAEASGAISHETAMVYRVFVIFDDTRLPAQYHGVDNEMEDSLYLSEVREKFDTLSPATQQLLQPFLIPPAYPGSWANPAQSGVTAQTMPPICSNASWSPSWGFLDTTANVPVRVWYQLGTADNIRAASIASFVQSTVWPKFTGLMRAWVPLSDLSEGCNGGDGRLDIYIAGGLGKINGYADTYRGCKNTPSFLVVSRTAPNRTIAHEIFHAFQYSFPIQRCLTSEEYNWWTEGSATWSTDFIDRAAQWEHDYAANFLKAREKPLDFVSGSPCDHCYGTYLLPFFVEKISGSADFVRVGWENSVQDPALEAVDRAIPGGFNKQWPEFTRYNWNSDPQNDYLNWDQVAYSVRGYTPAQEVSLVGGDIRIRIDVNLPRVSAKYKRYKFTNDNIRTVAWWNGITKSLTRPDEFEVVDADAAQKKGGSIWALIKIRGKSWTKEDWTERDVVTFCRDRAAERIDELILIISNSEFSNRNRKLLPTKLDPELFASNIGCWRYEGTASARINGNAGNNNTTIDIQTQAIFTSPGASPPEAIFYNVQGVERWTLSGTCQGTGSLPINPGLAFLFTQSFTPQGGTRHRGYIVNSVDSRPISGYKCRDSDGVYKPAEGALMPPWVFNDKIEPPLYQVDSNGVIDGTYVDPEGVAQYTWHFEPKREPDP